MIPDDYTALLVGRDRSADRLREAQRDRLARLALAGHRRHDRFYCRALTWLGSRLIAWGWRLQERYRVVVESH
jgi:hypothetical protein